jgi:hypothetical protein
LPPRWTGCASSWPVAAPTEELDFTAWALIVPDGLDAVPTAAMAVTRGASWHKVHARSGRMVVR